VRFDLDRYPRTQIDWVDAARIQPWRCPEAEIWTEFASEDDLPGLLAVLQMTEPEMFSLMGAVERLDGLDWMRGEGAGWVMPAFTWGGPGRFNDASFGCFYAARELETAVAETVHHQERFLRSTSEPSVEVRMRVLRADLRSGHLVELGESPDPPELYHPDNYSTSQAFGATVRAAGVPGIVYQSARRRGGLCAAIYQPAVVERCVSAEALAYLWDGVRIHRVETRSPLEWLGTTGA
jgi:RES domain-containing protein